MSDILCPVCQNPDSQSFWFWEKEEKLMRAWTPDTRVHFSICRHCGLIFQNPNVSSSFADSSFLSGFGMDFTEEPQSDEPMEWLKQFTGFGRESGTALEIYSQKKVFQSALAMAGWKCKAVQINAVIQDASAPPSDFSSGLSNSWGDPFTDTLDPNDQFDMIFCFDGFSSTSSPLALLSKLHSHLKENGGLYIETPNPLVLPRHNRFCLTSEESCVYPFQSLVFALYKTGFKNTASEICEKARIFCTKIEIPVEADPDKLIPNTYWGQTLFSFQRNFYWAWVIKSLQTFQAQLTQDPALLTTMRQTLTQHPVEKHFMRDVCGACLLFIEEISHLQDSLSEDWPLSMTRVFDVLKNDYALYDLLQLGPVEGLGTFGNLERFHYKEKLIYMSNTEYFERFFSQDEARQLLEAITKAGRVVVGHLSSFL